MTVFDEIAETHGDNEWKEWLSKVLDLKIEIASFVAHRRQKGRAIEISGYLRGSFNFGLHIRFSDPGPDAVVRFPKPGHTAFRDEKVANEVQFMKYLSHATSIPLPRVIDWGLTAESPHGLGPFIIMYYVKGTRLSAFLKQPTQDDQDDEILDQSIDNGVLDKVYRQIAGFMLQLSRLDFPRIGSVFECPISNTWSVTGRPLTYNLNELAAVARYPTEAFPAAPFDSTGQYFQNLADEHLTHLSTQQNLADDPVDAERRFIARHRFKQLIPRYCLNDAPFKPFCDDLQPSNMLIDEETHQITAVLGLEFTNIVPAQFTFDPPWWLLLLGPDMWLEHRTMAEFSTLYKPRLEQFLRGLEQVEESEPGGIDLVSQGFLP